MTSGMLAQIRHTGQALRVVLAGYLSNMESSVSVESDQLVSNGDVMRKGGRTRLMIVERAAPHFSTVLGYLQQGFDAHYARSGLVATSDDMLVGDNAYSRSVESRMIRDSIGEISGGKDLRLELRVPYLADLLRKISGKDTETSQNRIRQAAGELSSNVDAL